MTSHALQGRSAGGLSTRGKKTNFASFQTLRSSLKTYQSILRSAKNKYFSDIIVSNSNNPRVLFQTINNVLDSSQPVSTEHSDDIWEAFLTFFIDKVEGTSSLISLPNDEPPEFVIFFVVAGPKLWNVLPFIMPLLPKPHAPPTGQSEIRPWCKLRHSGR